MKDGLNIMKTHVAGWYKILQNEGVEGVVLTTAEIKTFFNSSRNIFPAGSSAQEPRRPFCEWDTFPTPFVAFSIVSVRLFISFCVKSIITLF